MSYKKGHADMPRTAVLFMDLQIDFLDTQVGRMPVGEAGALRVIAAANAVLSGNVLTDAVHVSIVNAFPKSARVQNFFRRNAAIAGTSGARIDPRVNFPAGIATFEKSESNAFSNPELHSFLLSKAVSHLCLIGVFAEGCVRATALGARSLGYTVIAPADAIATNSSWKFRFAARSMQQKGVRMPAHISEAMRSETAH